MRGGALVLSLLAPGLAACGEDQAPGRDAGPDADVDTDTDIDTDTDVDSDVDTDVDTDVDADTDTDTDTDTGPVCEPDRLEPPAIVFGGGEEGWSEIGCLEAVEIFTGPQGCCHFIGAIKERDVTVDPPARWAYRIVDEDGIEWARFSPGQLLDPRMWTPVPEDPEWSAIDELWMIMTLSGPEDVEDKVLTVTVRITESGGTEYFDSHKLCVFFVR